MNSPSFALDRFIVCDDKEPKGEPSYMSRLSASRRFAPLHGELLVTDEIQRFIDLLSLKAARKKQPTSSEALSFLHGEIDRLTLAIAERFWSALPSSIPAPEVSADPDGEVSFDWIGDDGSNFSVSVRSDARLAYAGAFGEGKTKYGTDRFDNQVPGEILEAVRELRG